MVDSVSSFNPIAYIQGIVNSTAPASTSSTASSQTGSSTSGSTSSSATNTTSSSSSTLGLSSAVLSLLQSTSSSSQDGVNLSTILGDGGSPIPSTDPLAGVYNALLSNVNSTAPLTTAIADTQEQQSETQAQTSPVEALLSNYNSAANAYNQTLIQNAQAVASANDLGVNGTPLVA